MIVRKSTAKLIDEGEGARVRRLFPTPDGKVFDPFVLFDEFNFGHPSGFPFHPHRGFEIISYVLEGVLHHRDNLGNEGLIKSEGLQKVTAGSGIIHSEYPGSPESLRGLQLWINLPSKDKQIEPSYQQLEAKDIPERKWQGGRIRVLCGANSPVQLVSSVVLYDVELSEDHIFRCLVEKTFQGIVYVLKGTLQMNGHVAESGQALFWEAGENIVVQAATESRFILLAGLPFGETIHINGTFVD